MTDALSVHSEEPGVLETLMFGNDGCGRGIAGGTVDIEAGTVVFESEAESMFLGVGGGHAYENLLKIWVSNSFKVKVNGSGVSFEVSWVASCGLGQAAAAGGQVCAGEGGFIKCGRGSFCHTAGGCIVVKYIVQGGCVAKKETFIDVVFGFIGAIAQAADIDFAAKNAESGDVRLDACDCLVGSSFYGAV
jgi:hypothetical protein